MNALLTTAAEIQSFLRDAGQRFCFIGGVAVQRWGEPRLTRDVDLTLLCPYGGEVQAAELLLAGFSPRIPNAKAFAVEHRVVLLSGALSIPIDVALGGIPFEERCIERASDFDFGGVSLLTCSAEDLIVLKAFADRERDWADIETVVIRQAARMDWSLVFAELHPLAAVRGGGETISRLETLKQRSG